MHTISQLTYFLRFLQSSSSNLLLNQANSTNEHGIASITCLQAGMHFFLGNFTEHEINLRVVAGLHGFHLYAADHWVDDLLTAVATAATSISELPLYRLAVTLAERASGLANDTTLEEHQRECNDIDARLGLIPDFSVRELAKSAIESRSPKALELQVSFLSGKPSSAAGISSSYLTFLQIQQGPPEFELRPLLGHHCKLLSRHIKTLFDTSSNRPITQVYRLKSFNDLNTSFATLPSLAGSVVAPTLLLDLYQRQCAMSTSWPIANRLCVHSQIVGIHPFPL